jgi:hypothetical protein
LSTDKKPDVLEIEGDEAAAALNARPVFLKFAKKSPYKITKLVIRPFTDIISSCPDPRHFIPGFINVDNIMGLGTMSELRTVFEITRHVESSYTTFTVSRTFGDGTKEFRSGGNMMSRGDGLDNFLKAAIAPSDTVLLVIRSGDRRSSGENIMEIYTTPQRENSSLLAQDEFKDWVNAAAALSKVDAFLES